MMADKDCEAQRRDGRDAALRWLSIQYARLAVQARLDAQPIQRSEPIRVTRNAKNLGRVSEAVPEKVADKQMKWEFIRRIKYATSCNATLVEISRMTGLSTTRLSQIKNSKLPEVAPLQRYLNEVGDYQRLAPQTLKLNGKPSIDMGVWHGP